MKKFELNITQRTAVGNIPNAATDIHVIRLNTDNELFTTDNPKKFLYNAPADAFDTVAVVTFCHPTPLWGSWKENMADFGRFALEKLKDEDMAEQNYYGIWFWKDNKNAKWTLYNTIIGGAQL